MPFVIDTSELDAFIELLSWRASNFVPDCMAEGKRHADSYVAAGGRHRPSRARFHTITRAPVRRETGPLIEEQTEKIFYHRFVNFWAPDF